MNDANENIEIDPLWCLHDEFTVEQAAALIAGYNPGDIARLLEMGVPAVISSFPKLYPAQTALVNAINAGRLIATIRRDARLQGWDEFPNIGEATREIKPDDGPHQGEHGDTVIYRESPDWGKSTVTLDDLRAWLTSRGMKTGFFFPGATDAPDYLDPDNPRFAPKLAAAVRAWQSVTDPGGRSPKQALEKWLREHASEFGLVDDEGNPINQAVEECSKVANWSQGGGAPKTPGG